MKTSLLVKLVCGIAVLGAILPASAFAQATRTWVSGVGDDANPCSRTAPCKTFAGAISKTAAKGEINCLDPGGFGGVTITKSIAIKCAYTEGGVLVSGTNAIVVNAAATDTVILEGLDINGIGTGLNGIRILQAKSVKVLYTQIFGFVRNAIDFEPSNAGAKLFAYHNYLFDNAGNGVLVAPPNGGSGFATVRDNQIVGNGCGIVATNHLADPAFNFAANCGTQLAGVGGSANISAFENSVAESNTTAGAAGSTGVMTNGQNSVIRIGLNEITGNTNGLRSIDVGLGGIFSFNDNYIQGNITNGTATGIIGKG